jgi:hypothetical protein
MVKSITAISRLVRRSPGHTQIEPEGPLSVTNSANPHNAVTAATRPSDLQTRAVGASESAGSLESRPIVAASLCRGCQLGKGGSSAGILTQRAPTARGAPVTGPATHPSPTSRHWIRLSHRSERTPSTSSFFRHTPILAAEPRAV